MIQRLLLCLSACILLASTGRADVLPPQFDDTIPPATPAGDIDFPTQVPVGKTLMVPVAASNPNGGALICSATSDNPSVMVRVRTGNPVLNLVVNHPVYSGSDYTGQDLAVSGTLQLMLFREFTPTATSLIAGMAQSGFYNNLIFHRIMSQFMIQGGDPQGDGTGGPGFSFENEFKLPLIFTGKGQLAMANAGFDQYGRGTNGSQFFITDSTPRHLDFSHTIFGQLTRGWDTLYNLSQVATTGTGGTPADKPLSDVTITSATITKSNDAVLFLSATGTGIAHITVTLTALASGTTLSTGTQFTVTGVADTQNDPVVLTPPADYVAPFKGSATVVLQAQDLECDSISYGSMLLTSSTSKGILSTNANGQKLQISGKQLEYTGALNVEVGAYQTFKAGYQREGYQDHVSYPWDLGTFIVGIGDKALTPQPLNFTLASGTSPQNIVAAAFLDKDSQATASNFLGATVNWGDGTQTSGTDVLIAKDPKAGTSARFLVSGTHAYPNPGIYPLRVVVYGNLGATAHINSTVNVSAGTVFATGMTFSASGGNANKKQVASFVDQTPLPLASYQTLIDWGDGVSSPGTVQKLSGTTSFKVIGTHKYTDNADYPVNVTITKNAETATAWSLAQVTNIKKGPFLPPFPQVHMAMSMSTGSNSFFVTGTTSKDQVVTSGTMVVYNFSNKKTSPTKLKFFLSDTPSVTGSSVALSYLGKSGSAGYTVPALAPGGQWVIPFDFKVSGGKVVSNTLLFWGPGSAYNGFFSGKYLIFQLDWSDPITDNQPINDGASGTDPNTGNYVVREPKKIIYGPF